MVHVFGKDSDLVKLPRVPLRSLLPRSAVELSDFPKKAVYTTMGIDSETPAWGLRNRQMQRADEWLPSAVQLGFNFVLAKPKIYLSVKAYPIPALRLLCGAYEMQVLTRSELFVPPIQFEANDLKPPCLTAR